MSVSSIGTSLNSRTPSPFSDAAGHEGKHSEGQGHSYFSDAVRAQLSEKDLDTCIPAKVSKVLMIYTGGTIGMHHTKEHGYVPLPNFLYQLLSTNYRFHQPISERDALLYNQVLRPGQIEPTLLPALITSASIFEKRIQYSILEYDPLLDSSNMTMKDWIRLAKDIELNYPLFDAFIILHGTDTMAFTSSMLSFMLENLNKTVILTGSQIPIMEMRNDAVENLLGALQIAGHFVIPEVTLYFNHKLLRGNRTSKLDAIHFDAFESPNFSPLVTMGIHMHVHWDRVWSPPPASVLKVHTELNTNVVTLRLFPGMTPATLRAFLNPSIQGVVVETFGAGNAPDHDPEFLDIFREASARGVVLVNCTQCIRGHVSDSYRSGKMLRRAGLVPGADMTPECAMTKLTFLLGLAKQSGQSPEWVRDQVQMCLRGELTIKHVSTQMHLSKAAALGSVGSLIAMETGMPDVNWTLPDFSGASPLHHAVTHGHTHAVNIMLRSFHGPTSELNKVDRYGLSPLGCALLKKFKKITVLLIHYGARLSTSEVPLLWSSLHQIFQSGDVEWLSLYISAGLDINFQGSDGKSLLHMAITYLQFELTEYLMNQNQIKLDLADVYGFTPLDDLERMEKHVVKQGNQAETTGSISRIKSLFTSKCS